MTIRLPLRSELDSFTERPLWKIIHPTSKMAANSFLLTYIAATARNMLSTLHEQDMPRFSKTRA